MSLYSKREEKWARRLCEFRGVNPDQLVPHGPPPNANGTVNCILLYSPMWVLVANEIAGARQMHDLMRAMDAEDES